MKILLVDDEMIAIEGIQANICFQDYGIDEVAVANSMEQAQNVIGQGGVDIVLCDIEMPNGSGLDLFGWINDNYPSIVKIILSCHTEFHFAQTAVGLSCQQYITKPATPEVLDKTIRGAVEEVHRRRNDSRIRKYGEDYIHKMAGDEGKETDEIERVRLFIEEHIAEDLSVEQLSGMAYMTPNYMTRLFKKKYGKTVVEYIMDYRLNLAEEMLKNTILSVTTVSAKVGYPNYAYFTKIFKRHTGSSPREYRAKNGKDYESRKKDEV